MKTVFRWGIVTIVAMLAMCFVGQPAHAQHVAHFATFDFGSHAGLMGTALMGMTAPMLPGKTQPSLLPFTAGTRRRTQIIQQNIPFVPGQPIPSIVIPQVGLLAKLRLYLEGTITQTAVQTLSPLGYASLFNRIRVNANLGSASIVDVSGVGLEMANYWGAPNAGVVKNTYGNAVAANRVRYGIDVPINANDRTLLHVGLINLQAEQVRVTLDVIPAALATYLTAGGGVNTPALTLTVEYEYWDVPNPTRYQLPPASLVRLLEDNFAIAATGDQIYTMPRLGTLAQMSEIFIIAGALANLTGPTPDITQFVMRANKTDTWMQRNTAFAEQEEAQNFNTPGASFLRPGVRTWDFFRSSVQERNFGDRDLINTEQITTLEFTSTVAAGVVPGANSSVSRVRRVFQRLV